MPWLDRWASWSGDTILFVKSHAGELHSEDSWSCLTRYWSVPSKEDLDFMFSSRPRKQQSALHTEYWVKLGEARRQTVDDVEMVLQRGGEGDDQGEDDEPQGPGRTLVERPRYLAEIEGRIEVLLEATRDAEMEEQPSDLQILRENNFSGMVPNGIWGSTSQLQRVDLSYNNFEELNLTSWCQALLKDESYLLRQQVNLLNTTIKTVVFSNLLSGLQSQQDSDIYQLLKAFRRIHPVKYLEGTSNEHLIIGLSVSGSFVLLILLARVWKRVKLLRQVQEELAKEDVRPPFYKYDDLRTATRDFSQENELGKGGFGAVYKAELADKSTVAVKLLFPTEQNLTDFLKEAVLITGIKHRNLVQLKGCCVRDKKRMLVYEYAHNGNLAQALWGKDGSAPLTWAQRLKICVDVAKGLSYLHEELQPRVIHRDIKPQNILVDKDLNAKIADFGLARPMKGDEGTQATRVGGTVGYLAPEYATQGLITEKLDVYSYGILLVQIISGRKCFDSSAASDEFYLRTWAFKLYRVGCLPSITEQNLLAVTSAEEIESVLKIALSCLQVVHEKRPSMSEVVTNC
ncbi:hypothetical protein R1sor_022733 [Riccia sorocarpa]|uniref:Protein kinase domain-containing protein n=1 Tax=Riccia sorocarpa TaxID=122646 RepID=A0ABD3GNP1_9MARC